MNFFEKILKYKINEHLFIELDEAKFIENLISKIKSNNQSVIVNIELTLSEVLNVSFQSLFYEKNIEKPRVKLHSIFNQNSSLSISEIANLGYETWYPLINFSSSLDEDFSNLKVKIRGFNLKPISFGAGKFEFYRFQSQARKSKIEYTLKLNHLLLNNAIFKRVLREISFESIKNPYMANLYSYSEDRKYVLPAFINKLDGSEAICSCSTEVRRKTGGINSKFLIMENLCHLCTTKENKKEQILSKYDESIFTNQQAYINQIMIERNMTKETARTELFIKLGLTKWKSETKLYTLISKIFENEPIIREASPDWLERQRIDIYLPTRKLAIEYQGQQHFQPISIFGGEESFTKNFQRDETKKRKCLENNIDLVEFKFTEPLTLEYVRNKLKRYIF